MEKIVRWNLSISWDDIQVFIKKLNGKDNGIFRLPTEAEWEYAARAGTKTPFLFGNITTPDQVNYDGNYPHGIATKGFPDYLHV